MTAVVIDTNVLHVANGNASQAGDSCETACRSRLQAIRDSPEVVVLDTSSLILQEYIQQRFQFSGQPGVGDAFFRWLHQNQANPNVCEQVDIEPLDNTGKTFGLFPDDPDLASFDPPDRKFVAAALASNHQPPILNAVDSDWWNSRDALRRNGVVIEFLCPEQFQGEIT